MVQKVASSFTRSSVQVGEYTIQVRSNGSSNLRTIILVHGIGVSEKYYRRLADELSPRYNVVSINLPGFGEAKKPPKALNLDELAGVLKQFIQQNRIVNPIMVGQSMGCQIVARLADEKDLSIDKYILISPTINKKERTAPLQLLRLMQDSFYEPLSMNALITADYLRFGFWRYLQTQRYMIADELEQILPKCSRPVLLIRGGNDKVVPNQWIAYLLQTLKEGSLAVVKGAPHNLQFSHPKEVAKACIDFIER